MTERTATIKVDIIGGAAAKAMLSDIAQQRNELLKQSKIRLNIDAGGVSQAQRAMAQTRANALSATRDMSVLGDAVTSKAVAPMAQYSALLGAVLLVTQKLGPGLVTALQRSNVEFTRQRDLMRFWGASGYLSIGIDHFKSNLAGFVSTSGSGFTKWLQNTSVALSQYRTALAASAAVMVGMATAAALSSKSTQNYIQSTLDSRLMQRKLSDRAGAEKWIQSAEGTDWSAGRESRMGVFQTILSKNPYMGQMEAQKGTEDIEKFFFANQEMLKKKGYATAEALASAMSAQTLSGEDATKFEDIFGLGFGNLTPRARLGRVSTEAGKLDIAEEVGMRPEEILTKRFTATTRAMGDAVLPPLLAIMNMFVKLSDIVGKIPGLGGALGWAAVLTGIAAAGLTVISVMAGLIGPLGMVIGLIKGAHLATVAFTAAQWLLNVALTANPVGVVIVAIVALIGVLYLLEKKFGVVTKAWNALKAGMSSLGGAFKDAGGMGVLKIAVDTLVASNPMLKILLFQVDFLKKIWLGGETLNKIMGGAMTIWQSIGQSVSWIGQFVSWIGDILTTIQNTLGGGVGGVADKVLGGAGAAVQSVVNAAGDFLNPQEPAAESNPQEPAAESTHPGTDNAGNPLPFEPDLWYSSKDSGQWHKGSDLIKEWGPRANDARDLYKNAASATNPTEKSSGGSGTVTKTDVAGNTYSAPAPAKADSSKSYVTYGDNGTFDVHNTETGAVSKGFKTEKEAKDSIPKMAVGGTIIGSGSIIGHAGEEVSPASAVVGAKSTLERMSEAAEGGRGGSITVGGTTININVDRMDSDIDLERALAKAGDEFDRLLMFRLRNPLDSGSLRGIGYLRG
jgi:hypothetical protein